MHPFRSNGIRQSDTCTCLPERPRVDSDFKLCSIGRPAPSSPTGPGTAPRPSTSYALIAPASAARFHHVPGEDSSHVASRVQCTSASDSESAAPGISRTPGRGDVVAARAAPAGEPGSSSRSSSSPSSSSSPAPAPAAASASAAARAAADAAGDPSGGAQLRKKTRLSMSEPEGATTKRTTSSGATPPPPPPSPPPPFCGGEGGEEEEGRLRPPAPPATAPQPSAHRSSTGRIVLVSVTGRATTAGPHPTGRRIGRASTTRPTAGSRSAASSSAGVDASACAPLALLLLLLLLLSLLLLLLMAARARVGACARARAAASASAIIVVRGERNEAGGGKVLPLPLLLPPLLRLRLLLPRATAGPSRAPVSWPTWRARMLQGERGVSALALECRSSFSFVSSPPGTAEVASFGREAGVVSWDRGSKQSGRFMI